MQIRVLVADDFPAMRWTTRRLLQTHPDIVVVGEADTFTSTMRLVAEARPDVALVDLRMPMPAGFRPQEFEQLIARMSCVLITMSVWVDEEASEFSCRLGALARLDKISMPAMLIPTIIRLCSNRASEQAQNQRRRAAFGAN